MTVTSEMIYLRVLEFYGRSANDCVPRSLRLGSCLALGSGSSRRRGLSARRRLADRRELDQLQSARIVVAVDFLDVELAHEPDRVGLAQLSRHHALQSRRVRGHEIG